MNRRATGAFDVAARRGRVRRHMRGLRYSLPAQHAGADPPRAPRRDHHGRVAAEPSPRVSLELPRAEGSVRARQSRQAVARGHGRTRVVGRYRRGERHNEGREPLDYRYRQQGELLAGVVLAHLHKTARPDVTPPLADIVHPLRSWTAGGQRARQADRGTGVIKLDSVHRLPTRRGSR